MMLEVVKTNLVTYRTQKAAEIVQVEYSTYLSCIEIFNASPACARTVHDKPGSTYPEVIV